MNSTNKPYVQGHMLCVSCTQATPLIKEAEVEKASPWGHNT